MITTCTLFRSLKYIEKNFNKELVSADVYILRMIISSHEKYMLDLEHKDKI